MVAIGMVHISAGKAAQQLSTIIFRFIKYRTTKVQQTDLCLKLSLLRWKLVGVALEIVSIDTFATNKGQQVLASCRTTSILNTK